MKQHFLKRQRIDKELVNIFQYPLTIAVAAMGYGKTAAAREFMNNNNTDYIWLAVEREESSPQLIWDSLTWQLVRSRPEIGNRLRTLGFRLMQHNQIKSNRSLKTMFIYQIPFW